MVELLTGKGKLSAKPGFGNREPFDVQYEFTISTRIVARPGFPPGAYIRSSFGIIKSPTAGP